MSEGLLNGKRGVILGVANDRSIAWACARECAKHGASLVFSYLDEAQGKRVRKLTEAHMPGAPVQQCDVSDDESIRAFFHGIEADWDSIDFVVHSVAFAEREDLRDSFVNTPRANFARALDVSAYSLVAVAREASRLMRPGGSMVAMTYYGSEKVIPHYNVMGVAKAALEASTRYLAHDLGRAGIRVNCLSAGVLKTLSASAIASSRKMYSITEKTAPLQRNVDVEEVGKTAVYLLSDLASAVTGEVLYVDCGYNIMGMSIPLDNGQENA